MKKYYLISLLALALLLAAAIPANACWMPPEPFSVHSGDGARMLEFIPTQEETTAHAAITLYEGDEALWSIDDFHHLAFEGSFLFSDDLDYFAFFYPNTDVYALEFYANGERTRRYRVDELILEDSEMWDVATSVGYFWEDSASRLFDASTYLLQVNTVDDIGYEFDIRTGEIVRPERIDPPEAASPTQAEFPPTSAVSPVVWIVLAGGGLLAAAVIIIVLQRRKTNAQSST